MTEFQTKVRPPSQTLLSRLRSLLWRGHRLHILKEFGKDSLLLLALNLGVRVFKYLWGLLNGLIPDNHEGDSYVPFDTFRAMITIADMVTFILFCLLAMAAIVRFVRMLREDQ